MSTQYKESIYSWIPQEAEEIARREKYVSKYNPVEPPTSSTLL